MTGHKHGRLCRRQQVLIERRISFFIDSLLGRAALVFMRSKASFHFRYLLERDTQPYGSRGWWTFSSISETKFSVCEWFDICLWLHSITPFDRSLLKITISDVTGAQQPLPGYLTATILLAANLRNNPPQCAPFTGRYYKKILASSFRKLLLYFNLIFLKKK